MTEGKTYILQCTYRNCNKLHYKITTSSCHIFFTRLYSDGKIKHVPNLIEYPDIIRCSCGYVWVEKMKEIGSFYSNCPEQWKSAKPLQFLTISELFESLTTNTITNRKELIKVRTLIHQGFNDLCFRFGQQFLPESEEKKYYDNVNNLLSILQQKYEDERLLITELYRNIKEWDKCLFVLKTIHGNEDFIQQQSIAVARRISVVFELNTLMPINK